jgi:diaminopimelate decarboxylase
VERLKKRHGLEFLSIGGGLGIIYEPALASGGAGWWKSSAARKLLTPAKYAERLLPLLKPLGLRVLMEPGRFISGNAGILITRVEYVKHTGKKHFLIVDAAMNDLIRPAFTGHITKSCHWSGGSSFDQVGCGRPHLRIGRLLLRTVAAEVGEGDYLALMSAGARGR